MGLTITTELYTDAGPSNEIYVNIESVDFKRGKGISVKLNNYLDREARDLDPNLTVLCRKLFASIFFPIETGSPEFEEFTESSIFAFAYSKVKAKLIESELSVEDDI